MASVLLPLSESNASASHYTQEPCVVYCGIFTDIWLIFMVYVLYVEIPYMDPMGYLLSEIVVDTYGRVPEEKVLQCCMSYHDLAGLRSSTFAPEKPTCDTLFFFLRLINERARNFLCTFGSLSLVGNLCSKTSQRFRKCFQISP